MSSVARILYHANGQATCVTEYVATEGWLRTTWQGFITPADARRGAIGALHGLQQWVIPYLLNDNSQIQGPWFDSVAWLQEVWATEATRLGLRYVAHVAQPHTEGDLSLLLSHDPFAGKFELQLFSTVEQAAAWLHECQHQDDMATAAEPAAATDQQVVAAATGPG